MDESAELPPAPVVPGAEFANTERCEKLFDLPHIAVSNNGNGAATANDGRGRAQGGLRRPVKGASSAQRAVRPAQYLRTSSATAIRLVPHPQGAVRSRR